MRRMRQAAAHPAVAGLAGALTLSCGEDGGGIGPQPLPEVIGVQIAQRLPSLYQGDTLQLHVDVMFAGPEDPDSLVDVEWRTLDADIATVDADGLVSGIANRGESRVIASYRLLADTVRIQLVPRPFASQVGLAYVELDSLALLYRTGIDGSARMLASDSTVSVHSYDFPQARGLRLTTYRVNSDSLASIAGPEDGEVLLTFAEPLPNGRWMPRSTSKIAYRDSSGDLLVWDVSSTTPAFVTSAEGTHDEWSPDRRRIGFLSSDDELRAVHVDGSGFTEFETLGTPFGFRWSPDGKYLSFNTSGAGWTIAAHGDGATLRDLTPTCAGTGACPSPINYGVPHWATDARHVAFWGRANEGCFVYVVEVATSQATAVVPATCGEGPAWSYDDRWLAITSRSFDADGDGVLLLRADGSERRFLPATGPVGQVQWRP